jgi:hypothetical protein
METNRQSTLLTHAGLLRDAATLLQHPLGRGLLLAARRPSRPEDVLKTCPSEAGGLRQSEVPLPRRRARRRVQLPQSCSSGAGTPPRWLLVLHNGGPGVPQRGCPTGAPEHALSRGHVRSVLMQLQPAACARQVWLILRLGRSAGLDAFEQRLGLDDDLDLVLLEHHMAPPMCACWKELLAAELCGFPLVQALVIAVSSPTCSPACGARSAWHVRRGQLVRR